VLLLTAPTSSPASRPVILTGGGRRGARISRVKRPDGSAFTVTVPRHGVDEGTANSTPGRPWISDDTGRPELSASGFLRLAAAAGIGQTPSGWH
jgi:hypothetical protein